MAATGTPCSSVSLTSHRYINACSEDLCPLCLLQMFYKMARVEYQPLGVVGMPTAQLVADVLYDQRQDLQLLHRSAPSCLGTTHSIMSSTRSQPQSLQAMPS